MSKNFQNIALIAFIFVATSCGVSKHFAETRIGSRPKVTLDEANFRVIKTVKGEAEVKSFLGIGKAQRKLALEHAIKNMYEAANLRGAQTIVDILPSMQIKDDYLFVRIWLIEVRGYVIEFTDEEVKSEGYEIVLPVIKPETRFVDKEPTFEEILSVKGTTPETTSPTTTTVVTSSPESEVQVKQESSVTPVVAETPTTPVEVPTTKVEKETTSEVKTTETEVDPMVDIENLPSLSKMKREANRAIRRVNLDRIKTRDDYEEAMLNLDIAEEYNTFIKDENLAHQIKRMKQYLENRESTYN